MHDALGNFNLSLWLDMLEKVVDGSTNMVVVTDRERRIKWVNATYTRVTGWSLSECVGKRPSELLHGPQTSSAELLRLAALMRQGLSVSDFELVNHKKSGEPYHVALNIEPVRDANGEVCAYLSIQSDITERRLQERHTAELKQRLEVAQRLARLGRIDTEVESGRPRWSSEVFRILGMVPDEEPREFEGLLAFAVPEDVADLRRSLAEGVEAGEELDVEFRVIGRHGQQRWVRCRGVPACEDGRYTLPRSCSVQDITLYKMRIEEKRQRNEELNQLVLERTRKLEESNRALEEFSYALSHDLRSPLRHLAGYAHLIKENLAKGSVDDSLNFCDRIMQATDRMQSLIEGLLSFSRMGREGLNVERVDLDAMLREVVVGLHDDAGLRNIQWRIAPDLPAIQGDTVLLREVWINLLDNALKYTGHRDISEVEIGWHPHPDGPVFFVRDNGIGFDPAHAQKLFGMFQRLHSDPQFKGDGIGLALVRRIVESHGGRIWATSKLNQGATFYFLLPNIAGSVVPSDWGAIESVHAGDSQALEPGRQS
ncbi:ATP-binding protein [Hydrogenophaga sp.]|uniref:sensor histidine kinase n=1 Tax=Hydrogenophaga sp. TaxID=1904254 RepID=UPI0027357D3E|nr:ATP-binding protein [Hydrogenophaga sp.]MDP3884233.1 ATP-binding protein [Hydrogenophaga sp.]